MKIIIHAGAGVDVGIALRRVGMVVDGGLVSDNGKQYCFSTLFLDNIRVIAGKTAAGSHTFHVEQEERTADS